MRSFESSRRARRHPLRPLCDACLSILVAASTALGVGGCLDDIIVQPKAPTLQPVESPTTISRQTLRGTKPEGAAVLNQGEEIVAADESTSWEYDLALVLGDNAIELHSEGPTGLISKKAVTASIFYDRPCPESPTLTLPTAVTTETTHLIGGTKPIAAGLFLNDERIWPTDDETEWEYTLVIPAADAIYDFTLLAEDEEGRTSDPITFAIRYDTTGPRFVSRYPPAPGVGDPPTIDIPTNAVIEIAFDEPIFGVAIGRIVVATGGVDISGLIEDSPFANALRWRPLTPPLDVDTTYTVTVDPFLIPDGVGNLGLNSPDYSWTFTTGALADLPDPTQLTANAPSSVVGEEVFIDGTKQAGTSVWVTDEGEVEYEIVALNDDATWSSTLPLREGANQLTFATRNATGGRFALPPIQIQATRPAPRPPIVDPGVATLVDEARVTLFGTKPAGGSLLLDGSPFVCATEETEWSAQATLVPGQNELRLQSRDATGDSEVVRVLVNFQQSYAGLVPTDYRLQIFFSLVDLGRLPGISREFDSAGPNNYSVEAWLEGPIEEGEVCEMIGFERQNIEYVATIQSYIGSKEQKQVPYILEDYRGTDFLASMISGGVFSFLGLDASTDRRESDGTGIHSLVAGASESQLRDNYDCLGTPGLSGCTSATIYAGPHELGPWTPRARGGGGLLEQGDYLLFVQFNLDRSPLWLLANDFETCWGNPEDEKRGMHRVVRRVSLGSTAYTIYVPQEEELSGPDPEGAGELHFIDEAGMTIRWGAL